MKKALRIVFLIIFFIIFCLFEIYENSGTKVIEIYNATEIAVDFNGNGKADDGERICIPDIKTFTSNLSANQTDISKIAGISKTDAINIGYLSDELAKQILSGKNIKLEYKETQTPECRFADIYVDGQNYSDILLDSGLVIYQDKIHNQDLFKENLDYARKLNLVILNRKSGKYHKLDCKFGLNSSDYTILPVKDAEVQFAKCKYCLVRPELKEKLKKQDKLKIEKTSYPEAFKTEKILFLVSDYTNHLEPKDDCSHIFCKTIVDLVDNTKETLDMAIYDWDNNPEIIRAINDAKSRGVKIRVIYDKRTGDNYYPETDKFVQTLENTKSDEIDNSKTLTSMLMHNKFIISDNKRLLTGSMNFSKTGLSGFNANNIILIDSPEIANYYTEEFEQMFSGKFHTLKEKSGAGNLFNIENTKIAVYFSPQDKTVESALVPLIEKAEKYIYLPVFVITHKKMTEALINAKNRGVDVKIIIDATSTRAQNSTHTYLREAGIPLKTENYAGKVHNKSMIVDDKYVITGSMNFSNSGENKNDENCIIIQNSEIAKFYRAYFEYLWKKIPDIYLKYSVRPESKYSIGSCYDGIDNDYDGKVDFNDDGCGI